MESQVPAAASSVKEQQEEAVQRLCRHFSHDHLTASEFEHRLDKAYAARTVAELARVERGLPPLGDEADAQGIVAGMAGAAPAAVIVDPTIAVSNRDFVVSLFGGTGRKGRWTPAKGMLALTVMGGTELDFRHARFGTREVSVHLLAIMGGVDIIVPPGVRVEWNGVAIMGGVDLPEPAEAVSGAPAAVSRDAPVIRVSGLVCMGAVDIVERLPGESGRDARKRIKAAKKERDERHGRRSRRRKRRRGRRKRRRG